MNEVSQSWPDSFSFVMVGHQAIGPQKGETSTESGSSLGKLIVLVTLVTLTIEVVVGRLGEILQEIH